MTENPEALPVENADNPRVFVPPPLIFAGLLAAGLSIDSDPASVGLVQIIGAVLALIGLGLIATAIGLFHGSKTRAEPWQPSSALVQGGVYRFTRNPMYLGMAAFSLGIAVVFSSVAGALMAILATVIIDRLVISREEAYLTRRFGQDYLDYRRAVRRWL